MNKNQEKRISLFKLLLVVFLIILPCVESIKDDINKKDNINKSIYIPICTKMIIECYHKEDLVDCISQFVKNIKNKKNKKRSSIVMMIRNNNNNNIGKIKNKNVDDSIKKQISYLTETIVVIGGGIVMIFILIIFMVLLIMKK